MREMDPRDNPQKVRWSRNCECGFCRGEWMRIGCRLCSPASLSGNRRNLFQPTVSNTLHVNIFVEAFQVFRHSPPVTLTFEAPCSVVSSGFYFPTSHRLHIGSCACERPDCLAITACQNPCLRGTIRGHRARGNSGLSRLIAPARAAVRLETQCSSSAGPHRGRARRRRAR